MPTFKVTDPNTGQTLKLTGDSAPTEQELEEIFAQQPQVQQVAQPTSGLTTEQQTAFDQGVPADANLIAPQQPPAQPERTLGETAIGAGETALTLGTGATGGTAGMMYGTLKGIADAIRSGQYGTQEGADLVEKTALEMAQKLTYSPRTEAGQEMTQAAGEALAPLSAIPPLQAEAAMLGAGAKQAVASRSAIPAVQKVEQAVQPALEQIKPAIQQAKQAVKDLPNVIPNTKFKQRIFDDIQAGGTDKTLAKYMIAGKNKVKADPIAKEAIKQGFDEGVISAIKGASPEDKANMAKMVTTMQKGKENALYAVDNRPADIVGNSLLNRVRHVKKVNRKAGAELENVAKSLKGQNVEFEQPINSFMDNLDEIGVSVNKKLEPVFTGSDVEGLAGPQTAIKNIVKRLSTGQRGKAPDAYELHRMKKYIDEIVTYGTTGEGLKGKTERIFKQLRAELDTALDDSFPDYNAVNTTYADTVNALNDLQGVAGKKMNLFGANSDKAVGTLLRRLMSNTQSRVNLIDAVSSLQDISTKYGGKFNDNIKVQMLLADELDNVFGPVARSSLAGETAKGFRKGAELATGQKTAMGAAMEAAEAGVEKLRGINEQNAFKTLSELLRRKND